jgi:hypothetical protein
MIAVTACTRLAKGLVISGISIGRFSEPLEWGCTAPVNFRIFRNFRRPFSPAPPPQAERQLGPWNRRVE